MVPNIAQRISGYFLPDVLIVASVACESSQSRVLSLRSLCHWHGTSPGSVKGSTHSHKPSSKPPSLRPNSSSRTSRSSETVRFAKLWPVIGKKFAEDVLPSLGPMLADCRVVILDVGPGAGDQLVHLKRPENITAVYGAEPGVDLHAALRKNATKVVLGEKYRVLPCGAELESLIPALAKVGPLGDEGSLGNGVFDEVVYIHVLCGVPKQRETIERLYRYLKSGGRFVVGEHVVNDESELGSWVARLFQHFWMALG